MPPHLLNNVGSVVGYAIGLWLLTGLGNRVCKFVLDRCHLSPSTPAAALPSQPPPPAASAPPKQAVGVPLTSTAQLAAGRIIGTLERLIVMIGIVAGSWEIMAAVIALKTVARFKDLDDRIQAEYFLVGSLASLLWAIIVTTGLLWFDHHAGFDLAKTLIPHAKSP